MRAFAAALVAVATLGAAPPAASTAVAPAMASGALPAGGSYLVRPLSGAPVAAVELWFRAPSVGYGAKPVPSLARLAAQAVASSATVSGVSLASTVRDAGGRLAIDAYADSIDVAAEVPSDRTAEVVTAMTRAFFTPVLDDAGLKSAANDVAQEALFTSFDPVARARQAVIRELFVSGPERYPVLGDPKALANIDIATARSFAERAFRAQNALLVLSGAVDPGLVADAVTGRPGESVADTLTISASNPSPASTTIPFSELGGGEAWLGPSIVDERDATALDFIADYLFRPGTGTVSRSATDNDADAFIDGQFITLRTRGIFVVAYTAHDATALGKRIDAALAAMQTPLDPAAFARAKASFRYHILRDLAKAADTADDAGWYATQGNAAYAPGTGGDANQYMAALEALTPESVAQTAARYLGAQPARVTFVPQTQALK